MYSLEPTSSCCSPADGARGPPNEAVDVQKNRIIATAALKKAEPLADEGRCCLLVAVVGAKVMR